MLVTRELRKAYGKHEVLKGVNLTVKKGEIKGLIGVNGVGKTTLIECICGIKKIDGGDIVMDGKDLSDRKAQKEIKKHFGYMPQSFGMMNDLTVRENLGYLSAIYGLEKGRVEEVEEICGLTAQAKVLARNLSGGYRQLLSMACAMIHEPAFLILDEPTVAMDPLFRQNFRKIVEGCREKGATVLFITHYYEELSQCDSFACLADGRIAYDGSPVDAAKQEASFEALLERCTRGEVR